MNLKEKKRVEIFSTGTWNGQSFDVADLDEHVKAFNETKETLPPYLKLGHDNEQKFIQEEGLPAAGWISNMYREGEKLFADITHIPEKIHQLLERKAYRKVSIEQWRNVKIKDKTYKYMITGLALLGAETPGVMNLNDFMALYGLKDIADQRTHIENKDEAQTSHYSFANLEYKERESMKTEAELKLELELKAAKEREEAQAAELKKFKADADAAKAEAEKAQKEKAEAEKKVFAAEQKEKQALIDREIDLLISEKHITKGMRPYVAALFGEETEAHTFSVKLEKEEKALSKIEIVKELAKLFAAKSAVNLDENSEEGDNGSKNLTKEELEKYAAENKVSIRAAYTALMKRVSGNKT